VTNDPYGSLEPTPARPGSLPLIPEAGTARVLVRGARKRCPRCGERDIWITWFRAKPRCPVCDLRFESEEGGFLGAMVLNFTFACLFWASAFAVTMVLTVPLIPVAPVIAGSVVILGAMPIWAYPRSKMLWAAIEFLTARSEPDYHTPTARDPRARELE
jgi:uncharacterized protein (DUF983 family)